MAVQHFGPNMERELYPCSFLSMGKKKGDEMSLGPLAIASGDGKKKLFMFSETFGVNIDFANKSTSAKAFSGALILELLQQDLEKNFPTETAFG